MTIRTPAAPSRFALPAYERPVGVNPHETVLFDV
jgi:hypothetical protein